MITEDYVSVEVSKLLKEKGFDIPCNTYFVEVEKETAKNKFKRKFCHSSVAANRNAYKSEMANHYYFSCPTIQMAIKWLRKKGFHIFVPLEINYDEDERGDKWYHDAAYYPEIRRISDGKIMYDDGGLYAEPEQAYEVGIKYCLKNLI